MFAVLYVEIKEEVLINAAITATWTVRLRALHVTLCALYSQVLLETLYAHRPGWQFQFPVLVRT